MARRVVTGAIFATVLAVAIDGVAADPPPITAEGWGRVHIGMTLGQVAEVLGEELVMTDPGLDGCFYVEPVSRPGVEFMIIVDEVVRIEATDPVIGAEGGLHLGSSLSALIDVFGDRARVAPNHYVEVWRDVFVRDGAGNYGMVFEVDEAGRVIGIRGGSARYVGMVERCA